METHPAAIPPDTAGHEIVRTHEKLLDLQLEPAQDVAADASTEDRINAREKQYLLEGLPSGLNEQLSDFRQRFTKLEPYQIQQLGQYMRHAPPMFHDAAIQSGAAQWQDWIANRATDEQLVNLMQWNVHQNIKRQQDPAFKDYVATEVRGFKRAARDLIRGGIYSQSALARVNSADDVPVLLTDPLHSILDGTHGSVLGSASDRDIRLATPISLATQGMTRKALNEFKGTLHHEWEHAVIQNTDGTVLHESWFIETMAEMNMASTGGGLPETYMGRIRLYDTMLTYGWRQVSHKLGTVAFSGTPEEQSTFLEALDESWGIKNAFGIVSNWINSTASLYEQLGEYTEKEAYERAVAAANDILRNDPKHIFGSNYANPIPWMRQLQAA